MTRQSFRQGVLLVVCAAVLSLTATLVAQQSGDYPSPRYPRLRSAETAADLLDIARTVVSRPSRSGSGFLVGWGIEPGQRVLFAMNSRFDRRVIGALEMAIREAGGKLYQLDGEKRGP